MQDSQASPQRYRLTKIAVPENPRTQSAETVSEYRSKLLDKYGMSPPVDYYVEGFIVNELTLGECFGMMRDNRNGVQAFGIMRTTAVASIDIVEENTIFTTRNSIFKLEKINV